jgi:YVTN family beta-propeller protein
MSMRDSSVKFLLLLVLVSVGVVIGITPTASALSYPLVATIDVEEKPYSILYNAVDGKIYVGTASQYDFKIHVISDETNTIVETIDVTGLPYSMVYDSAKEKIYAITGFGTVSVIDVETNTVVETITGLGQSYSMAYDPVKGEIFVGNKNTETISVISDETNTIVETISYVRSTDHTFGGMAYDSINGHIVVGSDRQGSNNNHFSVISDETNTVVEKIDVYGTPYSLAYDSVRGEIYALTDRDILIINAETNTIVETISVSGCAIAYNSLGGEIYVTLCNNDEILIMNRDTNDVVATIPVGDYPTGIVYDSAKEETFVINRNSKTVSVISVIPVNDAPLVENFTTNVIEDIQSSIELTATDVENDPLEYSIVTPPSHGIISGTAPSLTYTPTLDYFGNDSFTFKVNDGTSDSNIASVNINVSPVNDIPVSNAGLDQSVDSSSPVTLDGSQSLDVDGDTITYHWVQTSGSPVTLTDGTVATPSLTTPSTGDTLSFMLTVSDGTTTSNPDVVNIYVGTPVPDPIPPPPPSVLSATSLDGSVSLSWQSPTDNGGETITDYIIEFKKELDSTWQVHDDTITPTTTTTISGLTNDENYQFRISSVSLAGVGDTSSLISETPEPTVEETPEPTVEETPEPTVEETPEPTVEETPEPTVEETPEPTVEETPEPTVEETPEPTVEETPEPTVEETPEPTSKEILSFVDTTKDPKTYVERYVQEPSYKDWFDSNYPDYTIYEGIGITEEEYLLFVDSVEKPVVTKSQEMIVDLEPTSDIKDQEPTCGAGTIVKDGICVVNIVDPEPTSDIKDQEPTCGAGTIVKDGICVVDTSKFSNESKFCFLFWCW